MLPGRLAAAVTPLAEDGTRLDEAAFEPLSTFYAAAALDGLLALGTTGRGSCSRARSGSGRRSASWPRPPAGDRPLRRAVDGRHRRARRACRRGGRRGVAVIAPPYFQLDEPRAARPFRRRGARVRAAAVLRLRVRARERLRGAARGDRGVARAAPNLAGLKVSDTPFAAVEPYLLEGLDVFVGNEALIAGVEPAPSAACRDSPRSSRTSRGGRARAERRGCGRARFDAGGDRALPAARRLEVPARPARGADPRGRARAAAALTDDERAALRTWHESS